MQAPDFASLRRTMVDRQLRTFDVVDQAVLARFLSVPREIFVGPEQGALAYSDGPVSVGGRAILAPLAAARMLQGAHIGAADRVLLVGSGAGYTAALAAGLAASVVALESEPAAAAAARAHFAALGLANVTQIEGPLPLGAPQQAPFDVILVEGAADGALETLQGQLAEGGRLIAFAPRPAGAAQAILYEKIGGDLSTAPLFDASAARLPEFAHMPAFAF